MKKEVYEIGNEKKITRAEAIKKAGYIAVSAATMMILLSKPTQAYASPGDTTPGTPAEPAAPSKGIW